MTDQVARRRCSWCGEYVADSSTVAVLRRHDGAELAFCNATCLSESIAAQAERVLALLEVL